MIPFIQARQARSLLLLLLVGLSSLVSLAQTATYVYSPSDPALNDSQQVKVLYGSETAPASNVVSVSGTGYFPTWAVDDSSDITADFSGSWLCADGNCDYTVTIAADERSFEYTITRRDEIGQSGTGEVATFGGYVIVEVDLLEAMRLAAPTQSPAMETYAAQMALSYQPGDLSLRVHSLGTDAPVIGIRLLDLNGRSLRRWSPTPAAKVAVPVAGVPTGLYLVEVRTTERVYRQRLFIR